MTARRSSSVGVAVFQVEPATCKISEETAGEGVARAGGIEHILEQVSGHDEVPFGAKQDGAIFSALDDYRPRAHLEDRLGRAAQVVLAGKLAGFTVVDQQEVPVLDGASSSSRASLIQ